MTAGATALPQVWRGQVTWCDKLASTPTIGLRLDWVFATGDKLLSSMSPILSRHRAKDVSLFSIDNLDASSAMFTTNEGFQYGIRQDAISVGFAHRGKFRNISGGSPQFELTSVIKSYTELSELAIAKLMEAALLVADTRNRTYTRIGIVSNTIVDESDFPPGITKMVEYFSRPWGRKLDFYEFQATAQIDSTNSHFDRCIHKIMKVENVDAIPVVSFDWQRTFEPARPLTKKHLNEDIESALRDANAYFEELAEGNRFDEDVIRAIERN